MKRFDFNLITRVIYGISIHIKRGIYTRSKAKLNEMATLISHSELYFLFVNNGVGGNDTLSYIISSSIVRTSHYG